MDEWRPPVATSVHAAVEVAESFGIDCSEPQVLSDGASVVVHLRPSSVVAKVAAMTTLVRSDPAVGLSNEVHVATFLAGAGVAVVEPATDAIAPGVHRHQGRVMTFWRHLEHDKAARPDAPTAGQELRRLHDVLLDCPIAVPGLRRLDDVDGFLQRAAAAIGLTVEDRERLRHEHDVLSMQAPRLPGRVAASAWRCRTG